MHERRHFTRWQIDWQAKVRPEGATAFDNCNIKDISFKGMQVCLGGMHLPKDKFFKLCLVLCDEFAINIEAWLAWHKTIMGANTYGVYFSKISDQDKENIYGFICKYFPQEINKLCREELTENKGGETMEDRRIFARLQVKFPLRYLNLERNREGDAQVQDLCAKGLCLVAKEQLQPNSPLEMWLKIPDKAEPLYTRGQVVWSRPEGINECRAGICFERANLMGLSRVLRAVQES